MNGRWQTAGKIRDLKMAARIADCSAPIRLPKEVRREVPKEALKRAAIQIRDRRPDPATRVARLPPVKAAATVAGRGFRLCLRGHLLSRAGLSQAGRVNRPGAARWAVQRIAVRMAPSVGQKAGATVQRAVATVEVLVRHST
jgi:hypothetical protein